MKTDPGTIMRLRELIDGGVSGGVASGKAPEFMMLLLESTTPLLSDASRVQELERQLAVAVGALEKIEGYYNEFLGDIGRIQEMKSIARAALAKIEGEKK